MSNELITDYNEESINFKKKWSNEGITSQYYYVSILKQLSYSSDG